MTDVPATPKRRRWRWLVGGVVAAFLVFVWLLMPASPPVVLTTSEGHQITFLASGFKSLTYSRHPQLYRSCYQFLQRYAPTAVLKQLPAPVVLPVGGPPSSSGAMPLLLMFEYRLNPERRRSANLEDLVQIEFVDSRGHRYTGKGRTGSRNAIAWEGLSFESFPRRDRTFAVCLTDRTDSARTVRFEIPNPDFRTDIPEWTADELPQTKEDAQVVVTLPNGGADSITNRKPLPFEITIHDPAWKEYLLTSWIEDASGNCGSAASGPATRLNCSDLSPFEPVWKAKAVLTRTDPAGFTADEKRVYGPFALPSSVQSVSVPEPRIGEAEITLCDLEPVVLGRRMRLMHPSAADDSKPAEVRRDYQFRVDMRGFRQNETLIAVINDQDGRQLKKAATPIPAGGPVAKQRFGFRFTPKADTTGVSLTLIVSRPKEFEFYFEPPAELRGGRE